MNPVCHVKIKWIPLLGDIDYVWHVLYPKLSTWMIHLTFSLGDDTLCHRRDMDETCRHDSPSNTQKMTKDLNVNWLFYHRAAKGLAQQNVLYERKRKNKTKLPNIQCVCYCLNKCVRTCAEAKRTTQAVAEMKTKNVCTYIKTNAPWNDALHHFKWAKSTNSCNIYFGEVKPVNANFMFFCLVCFLFVFGFPESLQRKI